MISVLLPPSLVGIIGFVMLLAVLTGCFLLLLPFALIKFLVPIPAFRRACTDVLFAIVRLWGDANEVVFRLLYPIQWDVEFAGWLDPRSSYLLVSNHQSWIDILLVVHVFRHRVPPVCFFLKQELLWVPIIGFACWAMDFPFMKRHSREAIERNPALKNEDLETTRRACEKFRQHPATIVNFAEGTRFTEEKRIARQSPYRHLLRPKAAGLSFTLNAMGDQFAGVVDLTIAYKPTRQPLIWSFLTGEQNHIGIHVGVLPVPQELVAGNYQGDAEFRTRFQNWLNAIWTRKDARLDKWLGGVTAAVRPRMT
ncbi:MAG: acyltransferase [Gammaproteobacteria bacterium]|nr:acyltransferase [Gammaproteobacteria bacterium]